MSEDSLARFALEVDLAALDVLPTCMQDSPVKRHMDAEGPEP